MQLRELGSSLLVVGAIYEGDPDDGRNAYVFDGSRFQPLGGNLGSAYVPAVAVTGDGVWFGGPIAEAGSPDAVVPSVGVARFLWTR